MSRYDRPNPAPVTTQVNWTGVVGAELEQLLWALVEEMGATETRWRAGTVSGVNAADGGRDIEAVFKSPGANGDLVERRWWFESKGRTGTVSRQIVSEAVTNAAAYAEVDVVCVCTNSVFVNSAVDWAREWNRGHERPEVVLWDRENLSALVRQEPLAAARALPEALSDDDRLGLLLERFFALGEDPTHADLEYFWDNSDTITSHANLVQLVVLFTYADPDQNRSRRPWTALIPRSVDAAREVLVCSLLVFPRQGIMDLARPLDTERMIRAAAHLVCAVVELLDVDEAIALFLNPANRLEGEPWESMASDSKFSETWVEAVTSVICSNIRATMGNVCGSDCARVSTELSAFPLAVDAKEFYRRLGEGTPDDGMFLVITDHRVPCAVGLPDGREDECLVERDVTVDRRFVSELQQILTFRRDHPDGQLLAFSPFRR